MDVSNQSEVSNVPDMSYAAAAGPLQGSYSPTSGASGMSLATDSTGSFTVSSPALARYSFSSTGPAVCVDAVSGLAVGFPHNLVLPPVEGVTVTAITLLTVPARADSAMVAKYGSMADVVPVGLFDEVYAMFGYPKTNSEVRGSLGLLPVAVGMSDVKQQPCLENIGTHTSSMRQSGSLN